MAKVWKKCSGKGAKRSWQLTHGEIELIVSADAGPRILYFSAGGEGGNLLWEDKSQEMGRGKWRILGGHRLWIAPETEDCYDPDAGPCLVRQEEDALILEAPASKRTLLRKSFAIRPLDAPGWIEVRHRVENTGELPYPGALWALTCVEPCGRVVFPWSLGSKGWELRQVTFWMNWAGTHASRLDSPQWETGKDFFRIDPTGEEGKVGSAPREGWAAQIREDSTFLKTYPVVEGAPYVDAGCSLEVYTCSKFIELETMSPFGMFYPGQTREHVERWYAVSRPLQDSELPALAREGRALSPALG